MLARLVNGHLKWETALTQYPNVVREDADGACDLRVSLVLTTLLVVSADNQKLKDQKSVTDQQLGHQVCETQHA